MTATTVSWICQRCRASNAAGARACIACGIPGWGAGRQAADAVALAEPSSSAAPSHLDWLRSERGLLVPEILVAGALLVASPLWFVFLEMQGRYGAAFVLFLGVAQAVVLARAAFRMQSAGGLHVTSWVVFVAAAVAGSLSWMFA